VTEFFPSKLLPKTDSSNRPQACTVGSHDSSGFQCVDLTYIVTLLVDGYGLPATKELHLFKKINGHEASWALGVAYSIVHGQ
jgi:ectonucleoside triphosphate diphosphohydrolase 5/6